MIKITIAQQWLSVIACPRLLGISFGISSGSFSFINFGASKTPTFHILTVIFNGSKK